MFTTEEGARRYQEVLVPLMFAPSARQLVMGANLAAGAQVLDFATGTGVVARTAAAAAGMNGRVVAVDSATSMLAVARSQQVVPGSAPIEYIESTIEDAPLPDHAFDAALCQQALQFFDDPATILGRIRLALRPEGQLHIALWGSDEEHPLTMAMQRALIECRLSDLTWFLTKVHRLHNPALVAGVLRQGGFVVESHHKIDLKPDGRWYPSDGRKLLAATPLAAKLAQLPPEKYAELGDACERQLANYTSNGAADEELALVFPANFYVARPA